MPQNSNAPVDSARPTIREATQEDLRELANLIHFETHVHRHLDYQPALDWVGFHPFLILENKNNIRAALACPPDPPDIAWIRLFASSNYTSVEKTWVKLWSIIRKELVQEKQVVYAAAIPTQAWFESLLKMSHFYHSQTIVMLRWEEVKIPKPRLKGSIKIRPMTLDDLKSVKEIDNESFDPLWKNSRAGLELAFRQAAIATVAEDKGKLLGYQISTATRMGGHIARLAIYPSLQNQGIGFALLSDVLLQYSRRGARSVTVNTQKDNIVSLSLYNKAGFKFMGEEFPIYQLNLQD